MIFSTEIFTSAGIDGKTAVLCTILLSEFYKIIYFKLTYESNSDLSIFSSLNVEKLIIKL